MQGDCDNFLMANNFCIEMRLSLVLKSWNSFCFKLITLLVMYFSITSVAFADTCTSSTDGEWSSVTWSCGHTPVAGDDVVIGSNVTLPTSPITVASLTINDGFTLTQNDNSTHNVTGLLYIPSGGTLTHTANSSTHTYSVNFSVGSLTVDSGGSINVDGKGFASAIASTGSGPGGGIRVHPLQQAAAVVLMPVAVVTVKVVLPVVMAIVP